LDVFIGDNVEIGPHAVVYAGARIGADTILGDGASVREGTQVGKKCVIGRFVTINYDCEIADEVRFQDTTHITGGCRIGKGCFFGVGVITSNDRNVDVVNYHFPGSNPPVFGERVVVGSGANVLAGVTVGNDALIAAGAVVVTDVPAAGRIFGHKAVLR
jgi:acetyltransferase-like isoleucine patch superfamily enzyme